MYRHLLPCCHPPQHKTIKFSAHPFSLYKSVAWVVHLYRDSERKCELHHKHKSKTYTQLQRSRSSSIMSIRNATATVRCTYYNTNCITIAQTETRIINGTIISVYDFVIFCVCVCPLHLLHCIAPAANKPNRILTIRFFSVFFLFRSLYFSSLHVVHPVKHIHHSTTSTPQQQPSSPNTRQTYNEAHTYAHVQTRTTSKRNCRRVGTRKADRDGWMSERPGSIHRLR